VRCCVLNVVMFEPPVVRLRMSIGTDYMVLAASVVQGKHITSTTSVGQAQPNDHCHLNIITP